MKTCLPFVCVVLVCNVCVVTGADPQDRSLMGLTGVGVVIENLDDDASKAGLTKAALQTAVELRLRRNGIKVLSKEARLKKKDRAYFYVRVTSYASGDDGLYAFSVQTSLQQVVTTNQGIFCFAKTWTSSSLGTVGSSKFRRGMLESAGGHTDEFSNAYLKANPK